MPQSKPVPAALECLLDAVARRYQDAQVIPRCSACPEPCCALGSLVLELDWRRVRALWRLAETRARFDARLAAGAGPPEIRSRDGFYYAHGRPCPAFRGGRCAVYGQATKPGGCDDFPVYPLAGALVVDGRCPAADPDQVAQALAAALGPAGRVGRRVDRDFPFLVRLVPKGVRFAEPVRDP